MLLLNKRNSSQIFFSIWTYSEAKKIPSITVWAASPFFPTSPPLYPLPPPRFLCQIWQYHGHASLNSELWSSKKPTTTHKRSGTREHRHIISDHNFIWCALILYVDISNIFILSMSLKKKKTIFILNPNFLFYLILISFRDGLGKKEPTIIQLPYQFNTVIIFFTCDERIVITGCKTKYKI